MATNWDQAITTVLRSMGSNGWAVTNPEAAAYRLGDYGPIVNGVFTRIGNINAPVLTTKPTASGTYVNQASAVSVENNGGTIGGTFYDPEEGVEVKGGIQWQWAFNSAQSVFCQLPAVYYSTFQNVLDPVEDPTVATAVWEAAYQTKWMNGDGTIKSGFAVVVGVEQVVSGFIACSASSGSSFTLNGTLSGVSALVNGTANAYYSQQSISSGGFVLIYPADQAAPNNPDMISSLANMRTVSVSLLTFDNYMPSRGTGSFTYPYLG